MKLKTIAATAALGASLALAAAPAIADDFFFSFTNDVGNVAGSVTGEVFGLTDNATSAATSVQIFTWPLALIPVAAQPSYPAPIEALSWSFQDGNSFTVAGGVVTSGAFHADDVPGAAGAGLDRLWLNFGPCSSGPTCSFLSLGSDDTQFVWTGVAGTTFCNAASGACTSVGGSGGGGGGGGGGGIPEPAAWSLMLTGFAGLGAALRFNRRKQALAA
jgi:hypothetical protein